MEDNFDYISFISKKKLFNNLNSGLITESKKETKDVSEGKYNVLKQRIREEIISILKEEFDEEDEMYSRSVEYDINPEADEIDLEDLEAASEYWDNMMEQEEETEETEKAETEETEESEPEMGIDNNVGLTPEEETIQSSLKTAYDNAVAMGDQKLADQIGNSITFFTRTHVVER
jgi:hypothetical protein